MRLHKILCVGILFVVFVRISSFGQCGQTTQKAAASTSTLGSPTPKIAINLGDHHGVAVGVPACVYAVARVRVLSEVMGCYLVDRVEPVYPAETENRKNPLTLAVVVGKEGNVLWAKKISGPENLLPAAVDAVRKWKYRPYLINGEPIEVDTTVELPAKATSCIFTSAPPSWLFNTRPVIPVLAASDPEKQIK